MKKSILLILLNLFGSQLFGQVPKERVSDAETLLEAYLTHTKVPGFSVSISKDQSVIYSSSNGLSNIEANEFVSRYTEFRIGSVAKLFTAVAAVRLMERGLLNLEAPVGDYLTGLPPALKQIRIKQLLTHTSGIRHYTRAEMVTPGSTEFLTLKEALSVFQNDTLLFKPGTKYSYSSYGFILLGAIMEEVSHKKFNDIILNEIILPCGLKNTHPETYGTDYTHASHFYFRDDKGGFTPATRENFSIKWPAGGYLSTSFDLAVFGNALVEGKLTKPENLKLFTEVQKTDDGKALRTGFGFRIGRDWKGRKVIHHGGESAGARAFLLIYPEERMAISIVSNVFRAPFYEGEAETIASLFLDSYSKNTLTNVFRVDAFDKATSTEFHFDGSKTELPAVTFFKDDLKFVNVIAYNDSIRLIGVTQTGMVNFMLGKTDTGLEGKWGYDLPSGRVVFNLIKR